MIEARVASLLAFYQSRSDCEKAAEGKFAPGNNCAAEDGSSSVDVGGITQPGTGDIHRDRKEVHREIAKRYASKIGMSDPDGSYRALASGQPPHDEDTQLRIVNYQSGFQEGVDSKAYDALLPAVGAATIDNPETIVRGLNLSTQTYRDIVKAGEIVHHSLSSWTTKPELAASFSVSRSKAPGPPRDVAVVLVLEKPKKGLVVKPGGHVADLEENEIIRPPHRLKIEKVVNVKRANGLERIRFIHVSEAADSRAESGKATVGGPGRFVGSDWDISPPGERRAFCATGDGGGIDNSCNSGSSNGGKQLADAVARWKGDPTDLGIHAQDEVDGAPAPPSGSGKKLRAMAAALLKEVEENAEPAPTLYRGDDSPPEDNSSVLLGWTSDKKIAEKWAKKRGGKVYTLTGAKGLNLSRFGRDGKDTFEESEWIVRHAKKSESRSCVRDESGRFAEGNTCQAISDALEDVVGSHEAQSGKDIPDLYNKDGTQTDIGRKLHQMNVKEDKLAGLIKRMGGEPARTRAQIVHPGIHLTVVSNRGRSLYHIDLGYLEAKIYSTGARDHDLDKIRDLAADVFPKVYFRKGTEFDTQIHDDDSDFKAGKSYSRSAPSGYDHIDFTPPEGARKAAAQALALRKEHGRGMTAVGVARARDLSNGVKLSPRTIRRMVSFFARHEVDKKGEGWSPGEPGYPSAGRVAWLGWGGDAGRAWANKVAKQMDAADERRSIDLRVQSLEVFLESRNCGTGAGGFQSGNTCAHSKAADIAKGAAKGAAIGAASAAVGVAPHPPYLAKGAAVGAAIGAAKGAVDHSTRAGRIRERIKEIGSTERKVDSLVKKLGGTARSKADVKGDALSITIVNAQGQKAFHVDMTKDKIVVYPRRPTGRLSDAEIDRVKNVAKESVPKTTEIVVKSHSRAYVSKLIKSGFKVLADTAGALIAAYVIPPVLDVAAGEIKYEMDRRRGKR